MHYITGALKRVQTSAKADM